MQTKEKTQTLSNKTTSTPLSSEIISSGGVSQTSSSDYTVGHRISTTTTQPHALPVSPRFVPVPQSTVAQTSSSNYTAGHTTTTLQTRSLPTPSQLMLPTQSTVTQTVPSNYTVGHQLNTATKQTRALPLPPRPLLLPVQTSVTSTVSSDYPISHTGFTQKLATSSSSSGTVTQTLTSDYPISHSHVPPTKFPTKSIGESVKTATKEKGEETGLAEEGEGDIEDTETPNPFLGAKRLPHNAIRVGTLLGQGAFGQVYRGEWGTRPVALKKIDLQHAKKNFPYMDESQILESLQWEVSRLSTVSHPNLVQFYGVYEPKENELPYLVMEFCAGGTLQSVLEREQTKLPWSKRWQWALEIAQGLAYLHHQGVLHRDLKAENVLIDGNGRAKLGDLGVAQVDALLQGKEAEVVESGLQDKRFIAPENVDNPTLSTQATDIYALGLVFWQLVTGKRPRRLTEFNSNALQQWLEGGEREPIPNDCPPSFKALILACWEKDSLKRPSVEKLVIQLNSLATEFHSKPELIKACEQLELIVHPKRQEALRYFAPYVTENRVDEPLDTYWQRWEAKSENLSEEEKRQNPPLKLEETLVNFIQKPGASTLLLLGESGLGKTLSAYQWSDQLLGQWWQYFNNSASTPAPPYLPLFIRPLVSQWTHRNLRDAFLNALKSIGLQGTHVFLLVIVDGYDECQLDEALRNLVDHLGLSGQNNVKLIVTCRPDVVSATELSTRFAFQGQLQVRHFLPFKVDQLLTHLKNQLAWEDTLYQQYQTQLKEADELRAVLRNPFVLYLFTESWETISKQELSSLNRFKIYEGFVEHWLNTQKVLLPSSVQRALQGQHANLLKSFRTFASGLAITAFGQKSISLSYAQGIGLKNKSSLFESAWVNIETALKQAAHRQFLTRQVKLTEVQKRRALLTEGDYVQIVLGRGQQFGLESPVTAKTTSYEFRHKSFFEYYVAKYLLELIQYSDPQMIQTRGITALNNRAIQEESEILTFWYEGWKWGVQQALIEPFFKVIQASKIDKTVSQASANAATLLNAARVSFMGRDLGGVQVLGADLSRALLDHTNLEGANLRDVELRQAFLRETNFNHADLTNAKFGEFPSLKLKDEVCAIAYSLDGYWLAIVVDNIELWTGEGSKHVHTLKGHTKQITSVAFDPLGRWLASGSYDHTVRLWGVSTGKALMILKGHTSGVTSVAFDPLGERLVSGSVDETVRLWEISTGKILMILKGHTGWVTSVAFEPLGKWLASGSDDNTVRIWEVSTGKTLMTLEEHTDNVTSIASDPLGKWLASGSDDDTVRIWEVSTWKALMTLKHPKGVTSVAFDPSGKRLASGSLDRTVRVWDVLTGKALMILEGHTDKITSIAFDPSGEQLVSGSEDETVRLWEVSMRRTLTTFKEHTDEIITSVAFDPSGEWLASGSHAVRVWDVSTGRTLTTFTGNMNETITSVAFDRSGKWLASGSNDNTVRIWEVSTRKVLTTLEGHTSCVVSVAFDSLGERLVSGSWDHAVRLWEVSTGKALMTLEGYTNGVTSVAFDPSGERLAWGSWEHTVVLWEISTGKALMVLKGHRDDVISVAFDSLGKRLASGSEDKTIRVWEVLTGKALVTLKGHTDWVTGVTFDPSGERLASGSLDRTVRIWEVSTGKTLMTLKGHMDKVTSVAFDSLGEQLASGSEDKSILIWQCLSADYKEWRVRFRIMASWVLTAPGVQLEGAIISSQNQQFLEQRGAKSTKNIKGQLGISFPFNIVKTLLATATTTTTTTTTTSTITSHPTTSYSSPISQPNSHSMDNVFTPSSQNQSATQPDKEKKGLPKVMKETPEQDESKKEDQEKDKKCLVM